jgi:hypothetical protein
MDLIDRIEGSRFMKYLIKVGKEDVKIDLFKELAIDEDNLNEQANYQPQIFGYLHRVHKALVKKSKEADVDRKAIRATRIKHMTEVHGVTRARELVESDPKYIKAYKHMLSLEMQRDTLEGILDAFKQRASMIQTISANVRNSD